MHHGLSLLNRKETYSNVAANIPLDIFVDNISPYLYVEDILALRRVNKHYFHLTHEPLIWKRFLRELRIPLPPIRPTLDPYVRSSEYEFEHLVSRAISLEDNWRKRNPPVTSAISFDASLQVLDMKLLPGGKYLVASIRDRYRFFIALYHLDHPCGPHILARCQTPTKADQLQAKYLKYQEKPVIMIAYVCRVLEEGGPANFDPATCNNNADIDPSIPISHILNCVHVDLSTLDLLAGAHRDPIGSETTKHKLWLSGTRDQPFTQTVSKKLDDPIQQLSLYSRAGVAHLSLLQRPAEDIKDLLVIVNIEHPLASNILVLGPYTYANPNVMGNRRENQRQWIQAVRHIPEQNHVLIWRTIYICPNADYNYYPPLEFEMHEHFLELVPMPNHTHDGAATIATPHHGHRVLLDGDVVNVSMTDDLWPCDGRSDFPLQAYSQPPPPISIFVEMTRPQGILHLYVWPDHEPTRDGSSFIYHPNAETITKQTMYSAQPDLGHVIPGTFRALFYTTQGNDRTATPRLLHLRRYISPEFQNNTYRVERLQRQSTVERRKYRKMPQFAFADIELSKKATARYQENGLGVIAWDETIGRVCMTTVCGSIIEVLDFSHAAKPGERFLEWKMSGPGGFENRNWADEEDEFDVARKSRLKRYPRLVAPSVNDDGDVNMKYDDCSIHSVDSFYNH